MTAAHPENPPSGQLELTFKRTTLEKITVTYDEAREIFGLGGTSDSDLPSRVTLLLRNFGWQACLSEDRITVVQEFPLELTAVTDPADGYQYFPEL